jgi:N-acetylmuramoyl-L-alanine amidase
MIVGLDAGHGGTNIGCRYYGIKEEVYTLEIAALTAPLLEQIGIGAAMSRTRDETVSFTERARRLRAADFVLVLHVNAAPNAPNASDLRTYTLPNMPLALSAAIEMERVAPKPVTPKAPLPTIVSKSDVNTVRAFNTLAAYSDKPAVLVELFFATHEPSAKWAATPTGKAALATVLCAGAVNAWQFLYSPPPAPSLV